MKLLSQWILHHGNEDRRIELLQGDLACLPPEHAVDVLVVSAFPNDYLVTPGSVIGALGRRGLSVAKLASQKRVDMRQQFSCWLSQPVEARFNFHNLLCIESGWRGDPPENADDLFRALAPFLLTDFPDSSVAMPLIGAGDQGWPAIDMLEAILLATVSWIERGLKLRLLKIVILNDDTARAAANFFESFKQRQQHLPMTPQMTSGSTHYDVFVSYSHAQAQLAEYVVSTLKSSTKSPNIFIDSSRLSSGTSWPTELAMALDASRRVIALYLPSYWQSPICQLEFNAALARQLDKGEAILFPLLLEDVQIPYLFRTLQYVDCRVNDKRRLASACGQLRSSLI